MNRSTFCRVILFLALAVSFAWAQPVQAADPVVVFKTSLGDIEIQLDPKDAPLTTANFLAYVDKKFYDGTIFHRVIPHFVDQGGGITTAMQEKPTDPPIRNEASNGLHNVRGTISMARTNDPDSATSQFFLNLVDNSSKLDPGVLMPDSMGEMQPSAGYAVFGKIIKGLDVMDKIATVPTGPGDVPQTQIVIISARRK